jgi:hypothetical protein
MYHILNYFIIRPYDHVHPSHNQYALCTPMFGTTMLSAPIFLNQSNLSHKVGDPQRTLILYNGLLLRGICCEGGVLSCER